MVDPADDVVLETSEPVGHDPRLEAVVAEPRHRALHPRRGSAGRVDVTPRDDGIHDVVAVGEDVGEDAHRFAERRLGREGAVVDDWSDGFDDDSARSGGRKGHHVVGSSLSLVESMVESLVESLTESASASASTVRPAGRAMGRMAARSTGRTQHDHRAVDDVESVTRSLVDRAGGPAFRVRGVQVDRPAPAPLRSGNLPFDRLIGGVEDHEKAVVDDAFTIGVGRRNRLAVQENCDRTGESGVPVVVGHLLAVGPQPSQILDPADRTPLEPAAAPEHRMVMSECHHPSAPLGEVGVDVFPIEPGDLVVLAVGVVVAALGASELVAAEQHRNALGEQQGRHQVAALTSPQRHDVGVVGGTLDSVVPRAVVRLAVVAVLAVGLVVLVVVRHEVAQGEPVVGGDEVDRRRGSAGVCLVQVGAAGEAVAELGEGGRFAAPEVTDRVAISPVPFGPLRREVADLVAAFADVPRFGDQLDLRHDRILLDEVEERRQAIDLVELACEGRREVESESVDVHLGHPVAKAVHDQLQHVRVAHVHAVAGAGEVEVVARVVLHRAVVREVVDPAHRQRRAEVVALGGVVVHDVEDHLDARSVEGLDHRLELLHLPECRRRRVAVVRCEERDRVVAPVVAQPAFHEVVVVHELVHGHQLDRGDSETGQVIDDGRVGEAGVGPAKRGWHVGMLHGQTADVGLVDDRVVQRDPGRTVVAPVEEPVADDRFGDMWCAVVGVRLVRVVEAIAEARLRPVDLAVDRLCVRVEEQLRRVAPQTLRRLPGAMDPESVMLAWADVGKVGVPAVAVDLGQLDAHLVDVGPVAQQAEFDAVGDAREQREVCSRTVVVGAEWVRVADPHPRSWMGRGRGSGHERESVASRARLKHVRCEHRSRRARTIRLRADLAGPPQRKRHANVGDGAARGWGGVSRRRQSPATGVGGAARGASGW